MSRADTRPILRIIAVATVVRLLVALWLPLGVDESYAAVISRTLSLSYFDHPPAVFWLTHAAAALGGESPFALRWPFVLLFALTSVLLMLCTARLFGWRAAFWAVLSAQVIPVFSLSSGSWVLPDGPLLCASVAAALALTHAIPVRSDAVRSDEPVAGRWLAWIALGLALGAAGLSKYHAALLGVGILVFVFSDSTAFRWATKPQPYLALSLALLCVVPVFAWNVEHDWVSFRFQSGRASGTGNPVIALLQNLAGQAGYIFPWFWVPLIVLLVKALRRGPVDRRAWFCACLGAPPVIVFTLAALGGRPGLPHWPAPGFFLLLPLLGDAIARWEQRAPVTARRRMWAASVTYVGLVALVVSHAATGWMAAVVPSLHRRDPAFELLEYRSIRTALDERGLLSSARFIAVSDWLRASKIGYALGPGRPVLVLNDDTRHFRFAVDSAAVLDSNGLLIVKVSGDSAVAVHAAAAAPYASLFDSVRFIASVPVLRGADTALTVSVFAASGLRRIGAPPPPP